LTVAVNVSYKRDVTHELLYLKVSRMVSLERNVH